MMKIVITLLVTLFLSVGVEAQILTETMDIKTELPKEVKKLTKKKGTYAISVPTPPDSIISDGQVYLIPTGMYVVVVNNTKHSIYLPTLTEYHQILIADGDCYTEPEFWFDDSMFYTMELPSKKFVIAIYGSLFIDCRFRVTFYNGPSRKENNLNSLY